MTQTATKTTRVAIYTRKSTDDGLDQSFNTLDAQREAVEAYVRSQEGEGWTALPRRYDDGGFTGANTDRPGFQRLLHDIEAGRVDVVAVYKIDRLSRSLLDFARIMEAFEQRGVTFVSITQQFNTTSSMGKLILNVLMSFAEFERHTIAERTRDKMAATRRRGQWTGGRPVLGYDVVDKKLVVNPDEAKRVREIFRLYLEHRSLAATTAELTARGWRNKTYHTRDGQRREGRAFTAATIRYLLTNPIYTGQVCYEDELYEGAHERIVDSETWEAVQDHVSRGSRRRGRYRQPTPNLLAGLLHCRQCGCAMTAHYARKASTHYRYYVCLTYLRHGAAACSVGRAPAGRLERAVADRALDYIDADEGHTVAGRAKGAASEPGKQEKRERTGATLCWESLLPQEQARLLQLLVNRVTYDGASKSVDVDFHDISAHVPDGASGG